jgi:hypothetical protein
MADEITYRQQILTVFKDIITDVDGVEGVEIDRTTLTDIDTVPLAYVFIFAGPEVRARDGVQVMGFETWVWHVLVEVWAYKDTSIDGEAMEVMIGRIHKAIYDNYRLDGYAVSTRRIGADQKYFDLDGTRKAVILPFEVVYRHKAGNMYIPTT